MAEMRIFHRLAPPQLPPLTEEDRDRARKNPGNWFYYVDPEVPKGGPIYPENVMCGRKADDAGNVTDEYWMNTGFVPRPKTANMIFANAFELHFWLMIEGYTRAGEFVKALSEAELLTVARPEEPDRVPLFQEDGQQVLRVYTSAKFLPPDTNPWLRIPLPGMYILEKACPVERSVIHFNPDRRPSAGYTGSMLLSLWEEWNAIEAELRAEQENGIAREPRREPGRPDWMP